MNVNYRTKKTQLFNTLFSCKHPWPAESDLKVLSSILYLGRFESKFDIYNTPMKMSTDFSNKTWKLVIKFIWKIAMNNKENSGNWKSWESIV